MLMETIHLYAILASSLGVLGVGMTAAFSDFLSMTIPVPIGILLLGLAFVMLPTGDLMRLISERIDAKRPNGSN